MCLLVAWSGYVASASYGQAPPLPVPYSNAVQSVPLNLMNQAPPLPEDPVMKPPKSHSEPIISGVPPVAFPMVTEIPSLPPKNSSPATDSALQAPPLFTHEIIAQAPLLPKDTLEATPNAGSLLDYTKKTLESEEKQSDNVIKDSKTDIQVNLAPGDPSVQEGAPPHFVLTKVSVTGVSLFDGQKIADIIGPYINQVVDVPTLTKLRDEITRLYQENGYITSQAILPPQEIQNGEVLIHVVEAQIEDVQIEGLKHLKESYVTKRLTVKPGDVFQFKQLEKDLKKINQGNLVQVQARVAPGETYGKSDLILTAKESMPLDLSLFTDNQGRENLGFYRSGMLLGHSNLLGYGDRFIFQGLGTHSDWHHGGTHTYYGGYFFPLGTKGAQIGGNFSVGFVDVGGLYEDFNIHGYSYTNGLMASGPIWQGERSSLFWDIGLDRKQSRQYLNNIPFSDILGPDPEVRTVHAGITLSEGDKFGQTIVQNQITQGARVFGANKAFFKYNLDVTRIQALIRGAILVGRLSGQLTPDNLVPLEQFQIGGAQTVRGYREGVLTGDQGFYSSLELRVPSYFLPEKWERNIQWLGFFDAGTTGMTDQTQLDAHGGIEGNLRSVGVGVRGRLSDWLSFRVDAGYAYTDNNNEPNMRIHFGLSTNPLKFFDNP